MIIVKVINFVVFVISVMIIVPSVYLFFYSGRLTLLLAFLSFVIHCYSWEVKRNRAPSLFSLVALAKFCIFINVFNQFIWFYCAGSNPYKISKSITIVRFKIINRMSSFFDSPIYLVMFRLRTSNPI